MKKALRLVLVLVIVTGCSNPVEPAQKQLAAPNGASIPPVLPGYTP